MSGNDREQGAFAWPGEASRDAMEDGSTFEVMRPEAPPPVRGGGARGASSRRGARNDRPRSAVGPSEQLPPDNELWDVRAAARFLKRSVSWVYHKAEDGTLPVKRLGGWGLRFIPGELRAWVASDQAVGRRAR
jgi:predicted DNA-binding transcriptional regulator AlpA